MSANMNLGNDREFTAAVDSIMAEADAPAAPESASTLEGVTNEATEAVTGEATPATPAAAEAAPPAAPAPAVSDDTLVDVVIDGVKTQLPLKEALAGYQRHAVFTKKTQELAALRKEAEQWKSQGQTALTQAQADIAKYKQALSDPNMLSALYLAATGQAQAPVEPQAAPQAPSFDPAALRDAIVQDVRSTFAAEATEAQRASDVQSYTMNLIDADPLLKGMGQDYADLVYLKVSQMAPKTVEDVKFYIQQQVDAHKSLLRAQTTEAAKVAVVEKAKAVQATERAGSPPMPAPKQYKSFRDPQMEQDMLDFALSQRD